MQTKIPSIHFLKLKCQCCKMTHMTSKNGKELAFWTLLAHNLGCPSLHTCTHINIYILCSYLCTQIITLPFTHTCFLFPLPQCEMNPDTGEPQDTVTKHTKQLIQALGSHNTKISEIVVQQDKAVFTAIWKGLDRVKVQKVCIPCNTLADLASLLFMGE